MANHIALLLFVLFLSVGLGGGIYETLAVYPNWKIDPTPENLGERLKSSGQVLAGRRFWPMISPATLLLAMVNLYLATQAAGTLRMVWLAAAAAIIVKSIATYTYFVPTMIGRIGKPAQMQPATLARTVKLWTTLSPLRLCLELLGWLAALWAWSMLGQI